MLYQFTVTCIETSLFNVRSLGRKKWFKFAIMLFLSSRRRSREERNGFVKEVYVVKYQGEVSVCLRVFAGSFALKPFRDYSLCSVCILPQPTFYSQSAVCIVHLVCILPLVCSLQSAVRSLRFTLTVKAILFHRLS